MKKLAIILIGAVVLTAVINAAQLTPVTTVVTTTNVPPVTWKGAEADVIASQLLSITNADGSKVVPQNFLQGRKSTITIYVNSSPTSNSNTITAVVR